MSPSNPARLRRGRRVAAALLLAATLPAGAGEPARDAGTNGAPQIKAWFYGDTSPIGAELTRGVLVGSTNQVSFIVPDGFRCEVNYAQRLLLLNSRDQLCRVTIQMHESPLADGKEIKPEALAPRALASYRGGQIVDVSSLVVEGSKGPAFEINWNSPAGLPMTSRRAFVPCRGGYFEIHVDAGHDAYKKHSRVLNRLLLSFRSSPLGAEVETLTFLPKL